MVTTEGRDESGWTVGGRWLVEGAGGGWLVGGEVLVKDAEWLVEVG